MTAFVCAELRSRWRMLAGLTFGAASLLVIFAASYGALGDTMMSSSGRAPRYMSAFSGSASADLTSPRGWMGFGFNHPMFLILTLSVAITVGCAAVAGEVESGRAELLFVRPQARRRFLAAALAVWLIAELAVISIASAVGIAGADMSDALRRGGMTSLLLSAGQLLPLTAFVVGVAVLASAVSTSKGRATGVTIGVVLVAYLTNFVSLLISGLSWLSWLSPFHYYDPVGAATSGLRVADAGLLLLVACALVIAADHRLARRDLA